MFLTVYIKLNKLYLKNLNNFHVKSYVNENGM